MSIIFFSIQKLRLFFLDFPYSVDMKQWFRFLPFTHRLLPFYFFIHSFTVDDFAIIKFPGFSRFIQKLLWVFQTLVDGLSLESEWQKISSDLQDAFRYSGQSQQCSSLDYLRLSFYFKGFQSSYQAFGNHSNHNNINWYHRHLHVP